MAAGTHHFFWDADRFTPLCLLVLLLLGILSRKLYSVSSLGLLAVNFMYVHIKYHWGMDLAESRFEAAMAGPTSETFEYAKIYFGSPELAVLLHSVAALFLIYRVFRSPSFPPAWRLWSFAMMIPLAVVLFLARESMARFPPMSVVSDMLEAEAHLGQIAARESFIHNTQSEARSCSEGYEKIVIVIGESAVRDRMSLYGYPEKTTPFLDSLNPWHFNGIAAANQTRYAVPQLLTRATVRNFNAFFHSQSLVSELKECGYETYWISNQGGLGVNETYITSIASEADHRSFLQSLDYVKTEYDGKLIDTLAKMGTARGRKQAFFIHLRGSHFDYRERYPVESAMKPGGSISSEYDNSIFYTDRVLSGIFHQFESDGLLFAYASDHGEVVSEQFYGHGFVPAFREEYRIPFVVWTAKKERIDTVRSILGEGILNSESFNPLMEYLVGLDNRPDLSSSTLVLDVSPGNIVDYEKLANAIRVSPATR